MSSFVKSWEGYKLGGLFGAPRNEDELSLPWNRAMQAAFLIFAGSELKNQIKTSRSPWAEALRAIPTYLSALDDSAFYGEHSLLATDQGIRGFLFTTNDLCYVMAEELELTEWQWENVYNNRTAEKLAATEDDAVGAALVTLSKTKAAIFLTAIAKALSTYDWRTFSTPGLKEREKAQRSGFRGSGGYKELRRQLLLHLQERDGSVGKAAKICLEELGYE